MHSLHNFEDLLGMIGRIETCRVYRETKSYHSSIIPDLCTIPTRFYVSYV